MYRGCKETQLALLFSYKKDLKRDEYEGVERV
jgi:hypothetical protein